MEFAILKAVHVTTVAASGLMFFVRGLWMLGRSPMLERRWVRVVPHVNDTVLLVAGAWMAVLLREAPGVSPWLSAKIVALVIYVALGTVALRRRRAGAWVAALAVFFYIVAVALTHDALPWRRWA
ncbi:MAG TPA: SirB2 family protein [Burkholderiales bacterium]|nr:SirB2 family protein [Burkholderiales bacterium]